MNPSARTESIDERRRIHVEPVGCSIHFLGACLSSFGRLDASPHTLRLISHPIRLPKSILEPAQPSSGRLRLFANRNNHFGCSHLALHSSHSRDTSAFNASVRSNRRYTELVTSFPASATQKALQLARPIGLVGHWSQTHLGLSRLCRL